MHGLGVSPSAWAVAYGATTWASKSSMNVHTRWSMPSRSATRRASSISATEQQPASVGLSHSRSVTPTTSWPSSTRSADATEESTPPDMAASTFIRL
jgi:hypothetical protein